MLNCLHPPEGLLISDESSWVWPFCKSIAQGAGNTALKVASNIEIRENWSRLRNAPFILIHWENRNRPSGALIEEILEVDEGDDPTNRLIVVTTDPLHEDVIYFSELGLCRIVRLRNRDDELKKASIELRSHFDAIRNPTNDTETSWRQVRQSIERLKADASEALILQIRNRLDRLAAQTSGSPARKLEAEAALCLKINEPEKAGQLALLALENNPNFFRAWNTLVSATILAGKHEDAYALLQKLQLRNRASVKRLSAIGHELIALKDYEKAEHFFNCAIDHDKLNSDALNGLAEIKFLRNDLDTAKNLLAKSNRSKDVAIKLNTEGIEMVRQKNYQEALTHYTNAHYILPGTSEGPQIFYNIALAYAKWGKNETAEKFLKLALIKKPDYERATKLLERITGQSSESDNDLEMIHQT
jgi:tetratricopeptide (TPR) repeat protein